MPENQLVGPLGFGYQCSILPTSEILNKDYSLFALKGTVHEKPFFPGKCALGPSKYEQAKKSESKSSKGLRNGSNSTFFENAYTS